MSNEKETKGRFWWVIPIAEVLTMVAYLILGYKGIARAIKHMDFAGMFKSIETAIWFLIIATAITTILCFVPIFKSKSNTSIAIWNIIWLVFVIYTMI